MAPRKFVDTDALDSLTDETQYTEALLLADENAKDVAGAFTAFGATIEKVVKSQRSCWHAETIAQAMVDRQNYLLDQETLLLERAIKRAIEDAGENNAAQSPRFKIYFKEEPRRLRDKGLEAQVAAMKGWPALLRAEPEKVLQEWAERLEARFKVSEEVLQVRRDAQSDTRSKRVKEIIPLFEKANNLRQETHGELSKRTTQKNLGRDWPDSFFRTQERKEPAVFGELRRTLALVLAAKNFSLSEEHQRKIDNASEKEPLLLWLLNAGNAKSPEEIFG